MSYAEGHIVNVSFCHSDTLKHEKNVPADTKRGVSDDQALMTKE
jgi:hypothetical protein